MENLNSNPSLQTSGLCSPEYFGALACWGWAIVDPEGAVVASDAGIHINPDFGSRTEKGAKIEAITKALEWTHEQGYRNAIILTDDLRVAIEITGITECPKRCKAAYREVLQHAQEMRAQASGLVAWAPGSGAVALEMCREYFVAHVQTELAKRLGGAPEAPAEGAEEEVAVPAEVA